MIWKYFYSTSSAKEVGTMYQVRNLIGLTNVSKSPGKNFNASDDFIKLIITSYIVTAATEYLKMDSY